MYKFSFEDTKKILDQLKLGRVLIEKNAFTPLLNSFQNTIKNKIVNSFI